MNYNKLMMNSMTIKLFVLATLRKNNSIKKTKKDYLSMSWVDKFNGKMLYNDKKIYYKLNFN